MGDRKPRDVDCKPRYGLCLMLVEFLLNCNYFILYVSDIWDFKSIQIKEVCEY